jgi:GT2 family glycosyltransferase
MATAVLIVNYHAYDALHRCLTSLGPHLGVNDEVIVVDYESDEQALAHAINGSVPVATLPRSDNLGFAAGVNLAAAHSRAPFLLLLNPDTIIGGPVVRVLEDWLTSHPQVGVAGARILNMDGSIQPTARRFPGATTLLGGRSTWLTARYPNNWLSRHNLLGRDAASPIEVDWLSGVCLMTRRDVFEAIGGFDESFFMYWEDADYCRRVAAAGFRRAYIPAAAVQHVGGVSARQNRAVTIRSFHRSAFRLYWKQASLLGRLAAPLAFAGLWVRGEWLARRAQRRARS